jgi:hypothetical protein
VIERLAEWHALSPTARLAARRTMRWVPRVILLASAAAMGLLVWRQLPAVASALAGSRWELDAAALLLVMLSNLVAGTFWHAVLSACGGSIGRREALAAWLLSSVAKYGLGAVTQYASRIYLSGATARGRSGLLGVGLELGLIAFSGAVVVLALGGLVAAGPFLAAALLAGLLAAAHRLGRAAPIALALGCAFVNWLLYGAALWLLIAAVRPVEPALFPPVLAAMALATLAGLAALTPFGLGVRDVALTLLLAPHVGLPAATSAALVHRLWTVVAELAGGGLGLLLRSPSAPPASVHDAGAGAGVEAKLP